MTPLITIFSKNKNKFSVPTLPLHFKLFFDEMDKKCGKNSENPPKRLKNDTEFSAGNGFFNNNFNDIISTLEEVEKYLK